MLTPNNIDGGDDDQIGLRDIDLLKTVTNCNKISKMRFKTKQTDLNIIQYKMY